MLPPEDDAVQVGSFRVSTHDSCVSMVKSFPSMAAIS
jgi:hypothetical protein